MTAYEERLNASIRIIRALGTSFAALVEMRKLAELVIEMIGNDDRVDESFRVLLLKGNLGKSLGFLEEKGPEHGIPRVIAAALRVLQSYGNYGAHHDPEAAWPSKLAIESAMASTQIILDWLPGWLSRTGTSQEKNVEKAPKFKETGPRRGIFGRQFEWFLTNVSYPASNLYIRENLSSDKGSSVFIYPISESVGIRRGCLMVFLTHQMDLICDIIDLAIEDYYEGERTKNQDELVSLFRALSREKPGVVPDYVARDVMEVLRIKSLVSGTMDLDGETLDNLARELIHRNYVHDIARWFAEKYLGMSQLEIFWRRWSYRWMIRIMIIMSAFGAGKDCGKKEEANTIKKEQRKEGKTAPARPSASGHIEGK